MLLIRSLLFHIVNTPIALVVISIIVVVLNLNLRNYLIVRLAVFTLWWLKICCGVNYKIIGIENIPKEPGIVMCKHQSALEIIVLQLIFTQKTWVLKRKVLKTPVYGWGIASLQPIAIDPGSTIKSFRQIVEQGCLRLKQNLWVIIFPEGTRVAPGKKGKYLSGGGMLAKKSGANITPIAHNAGYLWPRNSFVKKPGEITFVIGPVIKSSGKNAKQITQEVENWIENTVQYLPDPVTN